MFKINQISTHTKMLKLTQIKKSTQKEEEKSTQNELQGSFFLKDTINKHFPKDIIIELQKEEREVEKKYFWSKRELADNKTYDIYHKKLLFLQTFDARKDKKEPDNI